MVWSADMFKQVFSNFLCFVITFSAFRMLVGHQEEHLIDELLASLSVWSECNWLAYSPADATATPSSCIYLMIPHVAPCNLCSLSPHVSATPNIISTGSAIFAGLTNVTNTQTMLFRDVHRNSPLLAMLVMQAKHLLIYDTVATFLRQSIYYHIMKLMSKNVELGPVAPISVNYTIRWLTHFMLLLLADMARELLLSWRWCWVNWWLKLTEIGATGPKLLNEFFVYSLHSPLWTSFKLEDGGNFASFELPVCQEAIVLGLCHWSFDLYVCIIISTFFGFNLFLMVLLTKLRDVSVESCIEQCLFL